MFHSVSLLSEAPLARGSMLYRASCLLNAFLKKHFFYRFHNVLPITDPGYKSCTVLLDRSGQSFANDQRGVWLVHFMSHMNMKDPTHATLMDSQGLHNVGGGGGGGMSTRWLSHAYKILVALFFWYYK